MISYRLVFDVAQQGYQDWWFPALLVFAALWIVFLSAAFRKFNPRGRSPLPRWSVPFALLVGVGGSALFLQQTYRPYVRLREALRTGQVRLVIGRVTAVSAGDPGFLRIAGDDGSAYEFHYSAHQLTPGYHGTSALASVGARVRVADVDGYIARLEVAPDSGQ